MAAKNAEKKATGTKKAATTQMKQGTSAKKTSAGKKAGTKASGKSKSEPRDEMKKNKKQPVQEVAEIQEREEIVPEFRNELVLLVSLVISLLLFFSNFSMSGKFGEVINSVTFGLFGVLAYVVPVFLFLGVAFYLANRKKNKKYIPKLIASVVLAAILAGIVQLVFERNTLDELMDYYYLSSESKGGGGLFGGFLCYYLVPAFGKVGTYVVLVALALLCVMVLTGKALFAMLGEYSGKEIERRKERRRIRAAEEKEYYEHQELELKQNQAQSFLLKPEGEQETEPEEEPVKEVKKVKNFFGGFSRTTPAGKETEEEVSLTQPVKTLDAETEELLYTGNYHMSQDNVDAINDIYEEEMRKKFSGMGSTPREITAPKSQSKRSSELTGRSQVNQPIPVRPAKQTTFSNIPEPRGEVFEPSFSEQSLADRRRMEGGTREKTIFERAPYGMSEGAKTNSVSHDLTKEEKKANQASMEDIAQIAASAEETKAEPVPEYRFPPIELLNRPEKKVTENSEDELQATAEKLKNTLESFGVHVTINNYSKGPAVTRYEIQPEQGVKVSKITNLADDIKLNLAAADVRIEAPIPGKAAVGIEVPNKENTMVTLRELIEAPEFESHSSNIAFTVGRDIGGQCIVADIAKMPHLLIAGATGSGKSVCINTIIMSILYKAHPDDVKLLMVDPKVVELSVYNGIPHLLIPVVTDPKKASAALNWAVAEMEERYAKFYELNARDLKGYNERVDEVAKEGLTDEKYPHYPHLVIIVDELADLMMVASGDVENAICRLAQKARAAGIHLILATQRPSVNVITGLIKANVPSRIAFAVSSGIDSRTILDTVGAEKLLGKGDMLFYPSGFPKPVRIQGAFVSDREVTGVVEFLKGQNGGPVRYSEEISSKITSAGTQEAGQTAAGGNADDGRDEYFAEAGRFIIERDKASIGMLQREYKIGFNRAARIMDQLADAGVVGPEEGTKPRKILMSAEEYEAFLSGT